MNSIQILGAIEIGLIYSLVTIAVYLTFRVINFADLTVDGSFTLGASVAASLIINDFNPIVAIIIAMLSGSLAGFVTGYLNTKWNIMELLAGILVMTALYSVNLRIMNKPNLALDNNYALFSGTYSIITLSIINLVIITLLGLFTKTDLGLSLRATGVNPSMSKAYGININNAKILTLMISNSLVALSGGLFTLINGFADISMGTGTIIIGLASVIIGEKLVSSKSSIVKIICSCAIGAVLYRIFIMISLNSDFLGLRSSDLNLITSIMITLALIAPKFYKKLKS